MFCPPPAVLLFLLNFNREGGKERLRKRERARVKALTAIKAIRRCWHKYLTLRGNLQHVMSRPWLGWMVTPSHITWFLVGRLVGGGGFEKGGCVSASKTPYQRTAAAPFNPHLHKAIPLEPCSPKTCIAPHPDTHLQVVLNPSRNKLLQRLQHGACFEECESTPDVRTFARPRLRHPVPRRREIEWRTECCLSFSRHHLVVSNRLGSEMFFQCYVIVCWPSGVKPPCE